jgi:hypothetical protein
MGGARALAAAADLSKRHKEADPQGFAAKEVAEIEIDRDSCRDPYPSIYQSIDRSIDPSIDRSIDPSIFLKVAEAEAVEFREQKVAHRAAAKWGAKVQERTAEREIATAEELAAAAAAAVVEEAAAEVRP